MDQNSNFGPEDLGTNPPDETPPSPITTQEIRTNAAKQVSQMATDATKIGQPDERQRAEQQVRESSPQLPTVRKNEAQPKPRVAGTPQNGQQASEQALQPPTVQNPLLGNSAASILKDPEQASALAHMASRTWASLLAPGAVRDSALQATNDEWVRSKLNQIASAQGATTPLWYAADQLSQQLAQQYHGDQAAIAWAGVSALLMSGHQDPAADAAIELHIPGWTPVAGRYVAALQAAKIDRSQPAPGGFNLGNIAASIGHFLWDAPAANLAKMPGAVADAANQLIAAPFKQGADVLGAAGDVLDRLTGIHTGGSGSEQIMQSLPALSLLGAGEVGGGLTSLDSIKAGKGMVGDLTRAKFAQAAEFGNPSRVVYAAHDADLSKLPNIPPTDPLAEAAQIAGVPHETVRAEGGKPQDIASRQGVNLSPGDIFEANLSKDIREKFGVANMAELVQKVKEDRMSTEEVKWLSSPARWNHDMTYPLVRTGPEDVPRTNPWQHIDTLPADLKKQGVQANLTAERFIHAIDAGPIYSEDLAAVPGSMIRSIGGVHEATDAAHATFEAAANRLAKGLTDENFQDMRRVMEGKTDLAPKLPMNALHLISIARNLDAILRQHYVESGYPVEATPNYFPRKEILPKGKQAPTSGGGLLTGEKKAHRQEVFVAGPKDQLRLEERFANIDDLNATRAQLRKDTVQRLIAGNPERDLLPMDPKEARQHAQILHPPVEGDWRVWLKDVQHRVNAFHAWQAKEEALHAKVSERDETGQHMNMAYDRTGMTESEQRHAADAGYKPVSFGAFDNILWHPKAAKLLERVNALKGKDRGSVASAIQDINNEAKGLILYSPLMHAMNLAGSLGSFVTAGLTHPGMITRHLVDAVQHSKMAQLLGDIGATPEARLQSVKDAARYHDARKAAYFEAGGVIPRKAKWASPSAASWAYGSGDVDMANHFGGNDISGSPMTLQTSPLRDALNVGAATYRGYKALQSFFWNRYVDLAVWAHAFEHERLMAEGESWNSARLRAADSASAWMGQIRPERWTPYAKANSALGFLAPNWWRSRAEVLLPIYDRAGLDANPGRAKMDAISTVRAAAAIAGFSFVSGNLLNYLTSGHWQNQNQPGNRNLLEWDRLYPPGPDGRHYVSTNSLARPTRDVEKLFNVDYQSQNPLLEFLNDKSGPLVQAMTRAANIDLHQSAHDGQLVHIDPGNPTEFTPWALAAAVASFLPGGQSIASGIESSAQDRSLGPYNTRIPKSVAEQAGAFANNAAFGLFGINAPYAHEEQTPGRPISGDQWYAVNQRQTAYAAAEAKLSDALLTGAMSPTDWYSAHKAEADSYHRFLDDTFKGAPYYTNGPLGLYHEWASLYDKAKDQYGQIDWARYDELEAQFAANHTQAQMDALTQQQAQSELKIPALKLFRDTNNAYRTFQEDMARQVGVPVSELRATLSQESAVFNDKRALQQLQSAHPELRTYAQAKARWLTSNLAGLMYGLYYDSSTVLNWIAAQGSSKEEVIREAENAELAAG